MVSQCVMTRIIVVVVVLTALPPHKRFDPYKKQVVDYGVPKSHCS